MHKKAASKTGLRKRIKKHYIRMAVINIAGKVNKHFIKKDFMLFLLIGGINTLNGTIISFLLSMAMQANIAFVLGYLTALVIAYFLNTFIIFRQKIEAYKLIKFGISYIPNFLIQNIVVLIFYNGIGWHRLIVFTIAAAIGIPVTFLFVKLYAFRRKQQ